MEAGTLKHYTFYVGANNATKKVETDRLEKILRIYFEGYTIASGSGYWQGNVEPCAIVDIFACMDTVRTTEIASAIAKVLDQQCVALVAHNSKIVFANAE